MDPIKKIMIRRNNITEKLIIANKKTLSYEKKPVYRIDKRTFRFIIQEKSHKIVQS